MRDLESAVNDSNPIPSRYRVQHLLLLVGANPLPNYVAARLLAAEGATVYLIHSTSADGRNTAKYAVLLQDALRAVRSDLTIELRETHAADSADIGDRVRQRILAKLPDSAIVGLHYTGGTKPMAVHTYQAVRAVAERFPEPVFSYLDAGTLSVYIEGEAHPYFVGRAVKLDLPELAQLHGYQLDRPRHEPQHYPLVKALVEALVDKQALGEYDRWLRPKDGDPPGLPDSQLPNWTHPGLQRARAAMDDLCGGAATPDTLAAIIRGKPGDPLSSCGKWFGGEWLEEWTLAAVQQVAAKLSVSDYGANMEPRPSRGQGDKFELDAAALLGYQLIVFSCKRGDTKGPLKTAFFEAFLRARQLGGDEARAALICLYGEPRALQSEVERQWQAWGQVCVFGRGELLRLPDLLLDWFRKLNP
jgi:hypothetical protein